MPGSGIFAWCSGKKKQKTKSSGDSTCNSDSSASQLTVISAEPNRSVERSGDEENQKHSTHFGTSKAADLRQLQIWSPRIEMPSACDTIDHPTGRFVDPLSNPSTPRNYQSSVSTSFEPKPVAFQTPRVMVVEDNRMFRTITQNENVKELLQQLVSEETSNSVLFQTALKKICSVPLDEVNHFAVIGEFSKNLREKKRLADVHIRLGDTIYSAHRLTLACFSEYFQDIFFSQGNEIPLPFEMNLIGVGQNGFQAFLDYIYSGKLDLTPETIAEVLTVAESLGVPDLKSKCSEYTDAISVNQALIIIQCCISTENNLFKHAFSTILQNFRILDQYGSFFGLDVETLCAILSNNSICIETEFDVFRLGMNWMMYNKAERQHHVPRIMHCVRFSWMTKAEVVQSVKLSEVLREDAGFQKIIFEAFWVASYRESKQTDPMRCCPPPQRICFIQQQDVDTPSQHAPVECMPFSSAGHTSNQPGRCCAVLQIQGDCTPAVSPVQEILSAGIPSEAPEVETEGESCAFLPPPINQAQSGVQQPERTEPAHLQSSYTIQQPIVQAENSARSRDRQSDSNVSAATCDSLRPSPQSGFHQTGFPTMRVPPTCLPKGGFTQAANSPDPASDEHGTVSESGESETGTIVDAEEIYPDFRDVLALGSFQKGQKPNTEGRESITVELSASEEILWRRDASLPKPRLYHAVITLHDLIYITGGVCAALESEKPTPNNEMFCFDPEINKWTQLASMDTARIKHTMVPLLGMIYAVGGINEDHKVLSNVECYNPRANIWYYVMPMPTARCCVGASKLNGRMYVVGGEGQRDGGQCERPILTTVEVFDPRKNSWTTLGNLRFPRSRCNLVYAAGYMFLCGGMRSQSEAAVLTDVDRYNDDTDQWEHLTDMKVPRQYATASVVENTIYLMGGQSATNENLQSVEVYNTSQSAWVVTNQDLPYRARWLACVALSRKVTLRSLESSTIYKHLTSPLYYTSEALGVGAI